MGGTYVDSLIYEFDPCLAKFDLSVGAMKSSDYRVAAYSMHVKSKVAGSHSRGYAQTYT